MKPDDLVNKLLSENEPAAGPVTPFFAETPRAWPLPDSSRVPAKFTDEKGVRWRRLKAGEVTVAGDVYYSSLVRRGVVEEEGWSPSTPGQTYNPKEDWPIVRMATATADPTAQQ